VTLTADQIDQLRDAWNSANDQMNGILDLANQGQELMKDWSRRIKVNPQSVSSQLFQMRDSINQRRGSLQSLYNAYKEYPNIGPALEEVTKGGSFSRLYAAFDALGREAQTLPPQPEKFETMLRPYANELNGALEAITKWAKATRDFAEVQSKELSIK
jgi:hypothetical protein